MQQVLTSRGVEHKLVDLAEFPSSLSVSIRYDDGVFAASLAGNGDRIDLSAASVAWWRRPQPFKIAEEVIDPISAQFAYSECYHAITGLWSALEAKWVNPPAADDEASHKPHQLAVAQRIGLVCPQTLITNDPESARNFVDSLGPGRTVFKAFAGTEDAWRETRVVGESEMQNLDDVRFAPVIFQEFVPAVLDLRVTVLADEVIASEIDTSAGEYLFDYRANLGSAVVRAHRLPHDVEEQCRELTRQLGLVYGAIDLRLTPEDGYVFLEINPSGQWLFMEHRSGQPITSRFCDLLERMAASGDELRS